MCAQRSMVLGDHTFTTSGEYDGLIGGSVTVARGVDLTLKGLVGGDLIVEPGAIVRLWAIVGGRCVNRGGSVLEEV